MNIADTTIANGGTAMTAQAATIFLARQHDSVEPGSKVDVDLVRYVSELSEQTRSQVLAFLHLTENLDRVTGDLHIDAAGRMELKLSSALSD
jgi:hypothetical protein